MGRHHDTPKKNRLVGAIQAGKTICQASEMTDIPLGTAKKIWRKFCHTGSTHRRHGSGRPSKVTKNMKRKLIRTVQKNRRMPFDEVGNQIEPHLSATTVRDHLAQEGYHRRVARMVPYLTALQKRKRESWAKEKEGSNWEKVIWSDECYVHLGDTRGQIFATHRADEEYEEDCLIPSFKQSAIRVMVWGCIMKGRKGPLVALEYPGGRGGGMTAKRYQEQVLEAKLLQFWTEMNDERGEVEYQHDGAPSHTAKSTSKWLKDHGIPIFPHPPSSPDVNPIESVWHELKLRLRKRTHHSSTVQSLIAVVKEVWAEIELKDIDKYIERMDRVVEAVLEAKGGHTKY